VGFRNDIDACRDDAKTVSIRKRGVTYLGLFLPDG
jgi:hypothetical protein